MKRRLTLTALAMLAAISLPQLAEAHGGGGGGGHGGGGGFHGGGFHGGGWGYRGGGFGYGYGYGLYPGYYGYGGCWRFVRWPYPHRVYVCY